MLRSSPLAFLLAVAAAPSCSDMPDAVEPKPGAAGAAGQAGGGGASAGKGGSGDDNRDAGSDEDAST